MTHEKAISILLENAGIQFDPHIVDVFVNLPLAVLRKQATSRTEENELAAVEVAG